MPASRIGAAVVACMILVALAAPWLAPHPPSAQPDAAAARLRPPATRLWAIELADRWRLADRVEVQGDLLTFERLGEWRSVPTREVLNLTADGIEDQRVYWLGTDRFGRDLLSRILLGTRVSLAVALAAVALAMSLGVGIGALAAVSRGWVDSLLMRLVDGLLAFPRLFLLLMLSALFKPSSALLILLLGLTSWMGVCRLVRAEILSLKEREFVVAARASGLRPARILFFHLLPNALGPVLALAPLAVGGLILTEAALSFLGLGIQPPQPSWGNIVSEGRDFVFSAWWISTLPGIAISVAVIGFNLLGDSLRDALDPRVTGS